MAITKTQSPYEFLVRWNNGVLSGAHIRFLETIADGAEIISQKEGNAQPVSMAGEAGFPLSDILTAMQAQALVERDAAVADKIAAETQVTTLTTEKSTLQDQLTAKTNELTAAQAQVTQLQADLAAAQAQIPPQVTGTVTMRQARLALLQAGLLDSVNTAIATMQGVEGEAARIEWEYASEVVRSSQLVSGLGAALGLTDQQLDDLFAVAATL